MLLSQIMRELVTQVTWMDECIAAVTQALTHEGSPSSNMQSACCASASVLEGATSADVLM